MSRLVRVPAGRVNSGLVRTSSGIRLGQIPPNPYADGFHIIAEVTMNDTGAFIFGLTFRLLVYDGSTLVDSDSGTPSVGTSVPFSLSVTEAGAVEAVYQGTSYTTTLTASAGSLTGKTWWPYLGIDNGLISATYAYWKTTGISPTYTGSGYTYFDDWSCGSFSDNFNSGLDPSWTQVEPQDLSTSISRLANLNVGSSGGIYWGEKTPAADATMASTILRSFGSGAHTIRMVLHENLDWFD